MTEAGDADGAVASSTRRNPEAKGMLPESILQPWAAISRHFPGIWPDCSVDGHELGTVWLESGFPARRVAF
jgi:hypothetical protein